MGRIIIYTFLAGASIVLLLVFRAQIFSTYEYFFEGPYRWVPEAELDRKIEDAQTRLSVIGSKIDAMSRAGERQSVKMDMVKQAGPLKADLERLREEKRKRPERRRYYFTAAAAVFSLAFLVLLRRAWLGHDPEFIRRQKSKARLEKKLAAIDAGKVPPRDGDGGGDVKRTLS